jgi:hypothetical protein
MRKAVRTVTVKAGLSMGIILVVAELAFGIVLYFLRPVMDDFINAGRQDPAILLPLITSWIAFLFLILAIYFACGMIVAKWLAPLPLRSREIATCGAIAGGIAELLRSIVATVVNFAISYLAPLADVRAGDTLNIALANAGVRLVCGLPAFIVIAAVVAGISAYLFSIIFFRSDSTPCK